MSTNPMLNDEWGEFWTEMAALSPQEREIMRKRQMVENLRGMSQQPQMRSTGRITTASNPLEHIASALGQGLGAYREDEANKAEDILGQRRLGVLGSQRARIGARRPKPSALFTQRPLPGEEDSEFPY